MSGKTLQLKGPHKRKFHLRPSTKICLSFLAVILIGSFILWLPVSLKDPSVKYIDLLFTSTSAVCVTGLIATDAYNSFTIFGQAVLAILIQLGGLGVTTLSIALILLTNGSLNFSQNSLVKEAWNIENYKGIKSIFGYVLLYTGIVESIGVILSAISFCNYFLANPNLPDSSVARGVGMAFFHSIAAFNNSGFDIMGNYVNLIPFQSDILLNLTTMGLIVFGGIGFLVVIDICKKKFNIKKFKLHTKVVLLMTFILLFGGGLLIKLCEMSNISWIGAFFFSVSARTAGFSTYPVKGFQDSTLIVLIILQFIGAAPGSTGGGIKVTTFFVIIMYLKSTVTNGQTKAFKKGISDDTVKKSFMIFLLALGVIFLGTLIISSVEHQKTLDGYQYDALDYFFETTSAFGTVGLSTGYTPYFTVTSKLVLIALMYIGRLGPLTLATLYKGKQTTSTAKYLDEHISIG